MSDLIKFTEIHDLITKYYPLGVVRSDPKYDEYQGTIDLKDIVADYSNNPQRKSKWDDLIATIKKSFPELSGITEIGQPFDVCYSLIIPINRKQVDDFIFEQRLYCHLSFLGNYFCMYGLDFVQVNVNSNKIQFEPVLTISPINNYEEYFKKIRAIIEVAFPTYRFLGYFYLRMSIDGLKIFSNLLKGNQFSNVFQALFIPKNIINYIRYGDMRYR